MTGTNIPKYRQVVLGLLLLSTLALPVAAEAEPSRDHEAEGEGENPLLPMIRKMGKGWGLDINAGRAALNPVKGTIILGDLSVAKKQQQILTIERLALRAEWKSGRVQWARVERGAFHLDLSRDLFELRNQSRGGRVGQLDALEIHDSSLLLTDAGVELLRLDNTKGEASRLALTRAEGQPSVAGTIRFHSGDLTLLDDVIHLPIDQFVGALTGRRLEVSQLDARSQSAVMRCDGALDLGAGGRRSSPAKVTCALEKVPLTLGQSVDVIVSGQLELSRHGPSVRLTGQLDVLGGARLAPGRWGPSPRGAAPGPRIDVSLRLKTPRGVGRARWRAAGRSGAVAVAGRPQRIQRLLESLSSVEASEANGSPE